MRTALVCEGGSNRNAASSILRGRLVQLVDIGEPALDLLGVRLRSHSKDALDSWIVVRREHGEPQHFVERLVVMPRGHDELVIPAIFGNGSYESGVKHIMQPTARLAPRADVDASPNRKELISKACRVHCIEIPDIDGDEQYKRTRNLGDVRDHEVLYDSKKQVPFSASPDQSHLDHGTEYPAPAPHPQ